MKNTIFSHLTGKICIITGGGGAIGSSLALFLAEAGLQLVILDLNGKQVLLSRLMVALMLTVGFKSDKPESIYY